MNGKLVSIKQLLGYSILAILSGLSGFLFIIYINKVIELSISSRFPKENNFSLIFSIIIMLFFISRRLLSEGIINLSQEIFWSNRKDIIQLVLKASFQKVVEYKDEVYSTLTSDVNNITYASLLIIDFISSIILIITSLIYMLFLSDILFVYSMIIISIGIIIYLIIAKIGNRQFMIVRELEQDFMGFFNSILNGVKEINVNPAKGEDIYKKIIPIVDKGKLNNIKAYINFLNSQLISQILFYGVIAFILINSVNQLGVELNIMISFVFILLYLLGPIVTVMATIPALSRAKISYKKLTKLKKDLHQLDMNLKIDTSQKNNFHNFKNIEFKNYTFSFDKGSFSIGPINLKICRNEIIFIYGGNGSGKTTFINSLLNLYNIDAGEVLIDNKLIPTKEVNQVKKLFSPIFSDFHLFDEFYGINNIDLKKAAYYLKVFELEKKVSVKGNRFSTIDLSMGQRKRLALISTILENRPILILDEWAADQDPYFRKKFYTEILHKIVKEENKTIIAITHDDKYYNEADRLFRMEDGQLINKSTSSKLVL